MVMSTARNCVSLVTTQFKLLPGDRAILTFYITASSTLTLSKFIGLQANKSFTY